MNQIPSSVPVFLENIEHKDNELFTRAKLKAFYVGETPDHRLFTKEFSDKVLKTLPLTPVVAYYSEEDEDFKGHNDEQYVYGVVPDNAEITYEEDEESGNTFAVTDVVLYTERHDNIGKIASKIIGKKHSLELDPDTLKYKINNDNQGRFLNIEFTDGAFIGLSVLGDDETPAFTGSCFFSENKDFQEISEKCKTNFDKFLNLLNKHGGKIKVFNSEEFFNNVKDKFAKITMQEFVQKIYSALSDLNVYGYVVENTDEYAIVSCWNTEEDRPQYLKYSITVNGNDLVLDNPVEVKAKYLTLEEVDALDKDDATEEVVNPDESAAQMEEQIETIDNVQDIEDTVEIPVVENAAEMTEQPVVDDETNTEGEVNAEQAETEQTQEEENSVPASTASLSATALSDSEKQELENYRRQEKLAMIADYSEDLDEEVIAEYKANVDNYTKDSLEAELAIAYRKIAKNKVNDAATTVVSFRTITPVDSYDENNAADVVKKYK